MLARGLNEESEIVVWSRAVATAILAGVIAKLILFANGALETIPLPVRVGAAIVGFVAYLLIRRSVFAGVLVGEGVLLVGGLIFALQQRPARTPFMVALIASVVWFLIGGFFAFGLISSQVRRHYNVADTIPDAERIRLKAQVAMRLGRAGEVLEARLAKASGNGLFDSAVLDAADRLGLPR